ncbi:TRAP-type C4-dicarboxylate transport system permease small subunit [Shimia isoporae]|uniref:TRAP transporter small permease protein n=1 Tax=Shimia isoporae TaxID=647720 RepID=A0A4R1NSW4_9RHOB|nr:TRAP transporter small permease [Shimia isoporae]TCL08358.1 TRAP-type C4-dicarboxylate transport system permease small subunit [Shimia isoporae]
MLFILRPLAWVNTVILRLGRHISVVALALMVVVILTQVFFRYVLNNALAWPDEAARFLMLWMVGLMAPSAMRWSGFVAIDTLPSALPRAPALVLTLVLLCMSLGVLVLAVQHGYAHTFGFGGKFDSSSLRVPLEWVGMEGFKVKLKYMYGSLLTCVVLLISVTVELVLRTLLELFDPDAEQPSKDELEAIMGAD